MTLDPDRIVALERELLDAIYRADKEAMRARMLPHGLGVDGSFGWATQASLIDGIHEARANRWSLHAARVIELGPRAVAVTYVLDQEVALRGRREPARVMATTVWVETDAGWQTLLHQETPVEQEASERPCI
jgi:hypothetical protein